MKQLARIVGTGALILAVQTTQGATEAASWVMAVVGPPVTWVWDTAGPPLKKFGGWCGWVWRNKIPLVRWLELKWMAPNGTDSVWYSEDGKELLAK